MNYLDPSIETRAKAFRALQISFAARRVERSEGTEISEDSGNRPPSSDGRSEIPQDPTGCSEAGSVEAEAYRHKVLSTEKGLGNKIDLVT